MNASEYNARRIEIDNTAREIFEREIRICTGMSGFDIQAHAARMAANWRSQQINNLALEQA